MPDETQVTFNIDFNNGFSIRQSNTSTRRGLLTSGSFHRLTPEQFDALVEAFGTLDAIRTLTTDGRHTMPKTFRTVEIDFGGLRLTLFADVLSVESDSNQLMLF